MTIKTTGSLSMSEINAELGRSNTTTNLGNPALRTLAGKATGSIKFSDFYGKSNEIVKTLISANSILLESYFTSAEWASTAPKRVIIPSGVTIGATTNYAIATSTTANGQAGNFGGTLTLENRGTISGIGGTANSGVGGNALLTSFLGRDGNKLRIENYGTIRAGGGGGGRGGNGGNGSYQSPYTFTEGPKFNLESHGWYVSGSYLTIMWKPDIPTNHTVPGGGYLTSIEYAGWTWTKGSVISEANDGSWAHYFIYRSQTRYNTVATTGGAGGNGARGQGFDGAAGTGANGAAGGTNAGAGGKGGNGGGWGASGATGATGANGNVSNGAAGSTGGLAGFYITKSANVTLVNSGTVQGRLG